MIFFACRNIQPAPAAEPQGDEWRIPVRVYRNDALVSGLQKSDFHVRLNGAEVPINSFTAVNIRMAQPETGRPRSFAVVLNISRSQTDLLAPLKTFFEHTLQSGDRLLVISNHFSLPEHLFGDAAGDLDRIRQMIETEQSWQQLRLFTMKTEMERFSRRLRSGLSNISSAIGESVEFFNVEFPRFMDTFKQFVREYRGQYIQIMPNNLELLGKFLAAQADDTWVITLFERGAFPQIKQTARFLKEIDAAMRNLRSDDAEYSNMNIWDRMMDLQGKISQMTDQVQQQNRFQMQRGQAVFHTLLIPAAYHEDMLGDDFEWRPVPLVSETSLVNASKQSGGIVSENGDLTAFFNQINSRDEAGYRLSIGAAGSKSPGAAALSIEVAGSGLTAVFNADAPFSTPSGLQFRVENPQYAQGVFSFNVKPLPTAGDAAKAGTPSATFAVQVNLRIVDQMLEPALNAQKEFSVAPDLAPIRIQLPKLKKGKYDIILSVTSPSSAAGDLLIFPLKI